MRRLATIPISLALASPAVADDWAQPVVNLQQSLAALGISLGGGVTGFGQGLAGGDGEYGVPFGGKADVLLGLDGQQARALAGFQRIGSLRAGFRPERQLRGDGSILPVNTALGFSDARRNDDRPVADRLAKIRRHRLDHARQVQHARRRRQGRRSSAAAARRPSGTSASPRRSAA